MGPKKMLGPSYYWVQTRWVKQILLQKNAVSKTFWVNQNLEFLVKKAVGQKKLWVQRKVKSRDDLDSKVGVQQISWGPIKEIQSRKSLGSKVKKTRANKTLGPKICWVQVNKICILNYCTSKKIFGSKNVGPKIMVNLYHFIMDYPIPFHYGSLYILRLFR